MEAENEQNVRENRSLAINFSSAVLVYSYRKREAYIGNRYSKSSSVVILLMRWLQILFVREKGNAEFLEMLERDAV